MHRYETETLKPDPDGVARAAELLSQGKLVAFATETVYGLGGDACSGAAVAAIFKAKQRPSFNPLIVHVPDQGVAQRYVQWNDLAERLADAFWPGPLTMVLPLRPNHGITSLVTAGLDTLAIRVPAQTSAQQLLTTFNGPIAAPSANISGRISPTSAAHVIGDLGGLIAAVLDDGPCRVGLESTIIGVAEGAPVLLRPGGAPGDKIEAVTGQPLARRAKADGVTAPGQLESHYAPNVCLRLNARSARAKEVMLGFGPGQAELNLSPSGDLEEAAANLFDYLHQLDLKGQPVAVATIPQIGLGVAINDRLRRAAVPRD